MNGMAKTCELKRISQTHKTSEEGKYANAKARKSSKTILNQKAVLRPVHSEGLLKTANLKVIPTLRSFQYSCNSPA